MKEDKKIARIRKLIFETSEARHIPVLLWLLDRFYSNWSFVASCRLVKKDGKYVGHYTPTRTGTILYRFAIANPELEKRQVRDGKSEYGKVCASATVYLYAARENKIICQHRVWTTTIEDADDISQLEFEKREKAAKNEVTAEAREWMDGFVRAFSKPQESYFTLQATVIEGSTKDKLTALSKAKRKELKSFHT